MSVHATISCLLKPCVILPQPALLEFTIIPKKGIFTSNWSDVIHPEMHTISGFIGWQGISPCLESRNHKHTLKENSVLHVHYYNLWAGIHTGTQTCRKASVNGGLHSPTRAGYLSQRANSGTERTGIYGEWAWVCRAEKYSGEKCL